jgi:hypothetical protein
LYLSMEVVLMSDRNVRISSRSISVAVALSTLLWGVLLPPKTARGQGGSTASIVGTVRDSSGAVIPGAQVVITQTDTAISRSKPSEGDGSFVFPELPVGPYRLEVNKEGFSTYLQTGIVLTVNQVAQVQVGLVPKAVQQTIQITAASSPVDTETPTLSGFVDQRQVSDLPLNGRDPGALALLAPGAVNPALNTTIGINLPAQFGYPVGMAGVPMVGSSSGGGALAQAFGVLTPVVNGLRAGGVYFALDGANNVDAFAVTGGPFPNPDAIQEFRVMTNAYGAEYVSAPGGAVNIVTKSGTNTFHGDVFEFLRNGALNARNFFAASSDNIRRNQFGGTAGGPIVKNKLFIFGAYQGTTLRSTVFTGNQFVPTAAQRAGNFSSIAQQLKNPYTGVLYPGNQIPLTDFSPFISQLLTHIPQSSAANGQVGIIDPIAQTEQQFVTKVDYAAGRHTLVARYFLSSFNQSPFLQPGNWLSVTVRSPFRWQDAMLGYNYARGKWVNEARLTFQRSNSQSFHGIPTTWAGLGAQITPGQVPGFQALTVSGYFTINGTNLNRLPRQTYTLSDRLSVVKGRHQISLGTEDSKLTATETFDSNQDGNANWSAQNPSVSYTSGNIMSDFMLGKVSTFTQSDGGLVRAKGGLWGFYGQDQIRTTSRLNLTLGLRWDPYWPFQTLHGRMSCLILGEQSTVFVNAPLGVVYPGDPGCNASGGIAADLHTFQPRVGFAYRLDQQGNTSIRGGYGIYAMQFPFQSYLGFSFTPPYSRSISVIQPPMGINAPWVGYAGGDPFASGFLLNDQPRPSNATFLFPLQVPSIQPDFKLANAQQWNLTLEHRFWGNTVMRASYVGTKGTHLSMVDQANPATYIPGQCGSAACSTTANTNARRPIANVALAYKTTDAANSSYQALQLSMEHRVRANLTISSNYTWSKSIDLVSQNANDYFDSVFDMAPNPYNIGAYRGLSDFDVSQSLATSFVWQLPSSKDGNFLLRHVLSHWQTSGVWVWQAGQPFSVLSGIDNSLSGNGLDHADMVAGQSPVLSPDRPRGQVIKEYFNTAAFQHNALGTFGNSGRNILRGPGLMNLDGAVTRTFPIKQEKYGVTFRAEFFNLPNVPQFLAPANSMSSAAFGQITAARDPRIIQFSLKFNW